MAVLRWISPLCALALCVASFGSAAQDAAGCARQFELAQRLDMTSFRDYDEATFRAVHHPDAVTVFASGNRREGLEAVMAALAGHFRARQGQWRWVERYRVVEGCRAAFILYETEYTLPASGYRQRALTGVTYTHDGRGWLAIADQATALP